MSVATTPVRLFDVIRCAPAEAGVLATLVMLANSSGDPTGRKRARAGISGIHRGRGFTTDATLRLRGRDRELRQPGQRMLFAAVLIMIIAVGSRLVRSPESSPNKIDRGGFGRLIAGLMVAASLLLFTLAVIMPVAHLGFFAFGQQLPE